MSCVQCAICRDATSSSDTREWCVTASCGHVYHIKCLEECLVRGKGSCPTCRVGAKFSAALVLECSTVARLTLRKLAPCRKRL